VSCDPTLAPVSCQVLVPGASSWRVVAPLSEPRALHALVPVGATRAYAIGGVGQDGRRLPSVGPWGVDAGGGGGGGGNVRGVMGRDVGYFL
jgi:hypothetical protein